jgi:hypothetical protein
MVRDIFRLTQEKASIIFGEVDVAMVTTLRCSVC